MSRRDEATGEVALCDHRSDWPTGHLQQPRRLVARLADPLLDELRVDADEVVSERLVHEEHHLLALAVEVVSGSEGVFVYASEAFWAVRLVRVLHREGQAPSHRSAPRALFQNSAPGILWRGKISRESVFT